MLVRAGLREDRLTWKLERDRPRRPRTPRRADRHECSVAVVVEPVVITPRRPTTERPKLSRDSP
jgi:hypothetical protein